MLLIIVNCGSRSCKIWVACGIGGKLRQVELFHVPAFPSIKCSMNHHHHHHHHPHPHRHRHRHRRHRHRHRRHRRHHRHHRHRRHRRHHQSFNLVSTTSNSEVAYSFPTRSSRACFNCPFSASSSCCFCWHRPCIPH